MQLKVNEIFKSIQGESTFAGLPCAFIRLSGCNLRCCYCDTGYAFHDGDDIEIDDICRTISSYKVGLVSITGGEPLLQDATPLLSRTLCEMGYTVLVETNGTVMIDRLPGAVIRIVDIKCPDSGEADMTELRNIPLLRPCDEVKFVISSRRDYDWSKEMAARYRLAGKTKLLFSAFTDRLEPSRLAEWILEDNLNVRLQIQLHKYILQR